MGRCESAKVGKWDGKMPKIEDGAKGREGERGMERKRDGEMEGKRDEKMPKILNALNA